MTLEPLRWPQAVALKVPATSVWAGLIVMPPAWPSTITTRRQQRLDRPVQYGTPESIFRHVEVLGFRLDIPSEDTLSRATGSEARQAGKLFELISPLNFHLDPRGYNDSARPDFYYRPATSGLTIELLRYGRMSMAKASGDLTAEDFQSQHELLVRLVVGRVDEDSAQAQEVATFVPALFVDNTWSKFLGRKFMGLDKRLAFFCARDGEDSVPLSPRDAAEWEEGGGRPKPRSLAEIAQVCLAQRVLPELRDGMAAGDASALEEARRRILTAAPAALEIACDPDLIDDWDRFELAPTDAVLRRSPIAPRRWRQDDFEDGEVRRDFARAAAAGSTGSFLGIQSAPIGEKGLRAAWKKEATWITGRYKMAGSAMLARPRGVITIKLHRLEGNPVEGWDRLCDLLNVPKETSDGGPGFLSVTLGPGSWYRLLYDMDLSLENGLE